MLAEALVKTGHEVVWWSSTYDHAGGRLRFDRDTICQVQPGYQLRLLNTSKGYDRAVSVARVINNPRQAWRVWSAAGEAARPDVIFCAMPTPELAWVAMRLARRYRVPAVIDARDMWPDIFSDLLQPAQRAIAWPYLALMRLILRAAVRGAAGCTAITEPFLDWILGYSGRPRGASDAVFPLGYSQPEVPQVAIDTAETALPAAEPGAFNVVFLGRLNRTVLDAFDGVIGAAEILRSETRPYRFYFAGTGDCAEELRRRAASHPEIVFLGQLGSPALTALKRRGHMALLCIARRRDYQISLSNKVFDYLASGLPLASHLTGLVGELVMTTQCGFVYDDGRGLAAGLKRYAADEPARREAGQRARQVFEERYDAKRVYPEFARYLLGIARPDQPATGV